MNTPDNRLANQKTFTHRVYFKKKQFEPVMIEEKQATKLIAARDDSRYKPNSKVTVGSIQCELQDISIIEKMANEYVRRGWYICTNEQCSSENKQHRAGERCDYDLTGKCAQCDKDVTEREREYTLYKYGRVLCYEHSPFGKASQMFPRDPSDPVKSSRMIGMAAYYIGKGLSDEQVVEAVNRDLTKKNIGQSIGVIPSSACKKCSHSRYHHSDKSGCSDCKCKEYQV